MALAVTPCFPYSRAVRAINRFPYGQRTKTKIRMVFLETKDWLVAITFGIISRHPLGPQTRKHMADSRSDESTRACRILGELGVLHIRVWVED